MDNKKTVILASPRIPSRVAKSGGQSVLLGMVNYYSSIYNIFIITRFDPDEEENCIWLQRRGVRGVFIKKYNSTNQLLRSAQKLKSWLVYYYYINVIAQKTSPEFIQLEWVQSMFFSFIPRKTRVVLDTHDINYILRSRKNKNGRCGIIINSFHKLLKKLEIKS